MRFGFCWVFLVLIFLSACNSYTSEYTTLEPIGVHPNGTIYIGMESCKECHLDIVSSHMQTAHWLTSSMMTPDRLLPLLKAEKNYLDLKDDTRLTYSFQNDSLFQEASRNPLEKPFLISPLNIIIGSGTKVGNSFLGWEDNSLYQFQGSYHLPSNKWINSPGFPDFFQAKRPIFPRCMECHTTFAQSENWQSPIPINRYNKNNTVFGIDCQRCHGSVVEHVKHHRDFPTDSIGKKILAYSDFSQKQRIDMCALCHSGVGDQSLLPVFSFKPGDDLSKFIRSQSASVPDVHSNQVGLLTMSKCFLESDTMDCMTCHDPHLNERNNSIKFNARCIQCHPAPKHFTAKVSEEWDCISCHMPVQGSRQMKIQITSDSLVPVGVRTHKIAIYKEEIDSTLQLQQ